MTDIFNHFFQTLTHILIILSMISILYHVIKVILSSTDVIERTVRFSALATGILIYYGSKTIGISIPSMMVQSFMITKPFTIGLFGIILPSLIGCFVAWYCVKSIKKLDNSASRLMILIISFITVIFCDVYVTAYDISTQGDSVFDITLLPNLTFTIALSLYIILRYKHNPPA